MIQSGRKNKYLDLARELKKIWNIRLTLITIVAGLLGTVQKDMKKNCGN